MKILFLIRSLETGGAERQLVVLANALAQRGHEVHVAVYYSGGALSGELASAVQLHWLEKRGRWDVVGFLSRLRRLVSQLQPDAIHGYLPTANLLALLAGRGFYKTPVVWGVRTAFMDLTRYYYMARVVAYLERRLSGSADAIICNSENGKLHALTRGFAGANMVAVANGIDTQRFRPDPALRQRVRDEWRIAEQQFLVGLVGRIDPMKDHDTFLHAAAIVAATSRESRFVCVGGGDGGFAKNLRSLAIRLGLADILLWVGRREDIPAVLNGIDLLVSSSIGEGFANVLGEAMACGTPCVATNVGDSSVIAGDLGLMVPPANAQQLAAAILALQQEPPGMRRQRGLAAREHIVRNFSVERLASATEQVLLATIAGTR